MTTAFRVILLIILLIAGWDGAETKGGHWWDHFAPVAIFATAGVLFIASMIYL